MIARRGMIAGGIAMLLLATSGVAIATSNSDSPALPARTVEATATVGKDAPQTKPAPTTAAPSLKLLKRSQVAADDLPSEVSVRLQTSGLAQSMEEELGNARLMVEAAGQRVWAVPTRKDLLCFHDKAGSGGCLSGNAVNSGRYIGSKECLDDHPTDMLVYGILPDGNQDARLLLENGESVTPEFDASGNAWHALVAKAKGALPTELRWQASDGEEASNMVPRSPDVLGGLC